MTFKEFLNHRDHLTVKPQIKSKIGQPTVQNDLGPTTPQRATSSFGIRKPSLPAGVMRGRRFTNRDSIAKKPSHFLPRSAS